MASKNTGEYNSAFLIGGASIVLIGGLIYYFMNKSDIEEKNEKSFAESIPDTSNLIEDKQNRKRKNKKKKDEIDEEEVKASHVEPVITKKVEEAPVEKSKKKNKKEEKVEKKAEPEPQPEPELKKSPKKDNKKEAKKEEKKPEKKEEKKVEKKEEKKDNKKENKKDNKKQPEKVVEKVSEKKVQDDEAGWTVVNKKERKAPSNSFKEDTKKAKQELKAYLGEF